MPGISRWTLIAIAVVAYALANIAHEGIGHGGMCLATGGNPIALSAVSFECDKTQLSAVASKWISAGGTLVNLLLAAGVWLFARKGRGQTDGMRLFWWLFFSVNALQAAGYWLFSGVGNVGDWAVVIEGSVPWRVALAVVGTAAYYGAIRLSLRWLSELIGPQPERIALARGLTLIPYLTGGVLYIAAGIFNPYGWWLVAISAAAASLGGTSALAWMYNLLRDAKRPISPEPALELGRSKAWLAAAAVMAVLFVAVLGPSIRL